MSNNRTFLIVISVLLITAIFLQTRSIGKPVFHAHPLNEFPQKVEGWEGSDIPIETSALKILGVQEFLNRSYLHPQFGRSFLYVGYHQTQKQGESIHSPKNCLPGSGWQPAQVGIETITLNDKNKIQINRYMIEKGIQKQIVYYWYQSQGRVVASEYWAKIYLVWDAMMLNRTDGSLVRVTIPISTTIESADTAAKSFINSFFPHLTRFIPS
jgi:EpsI family protein